MFKFLRKFFEPSVSKALEGVSQAIHRLDATSRYMEVRARKLYDEASKKNIEGGAAMLEAQHAFRVADKLRDLVK